MWTSPMATKTINAFNFEYHEKEVKILIIVFDKILQHPNEDKYQNLSLRRISTKLNNCTMCINVLYAAGFSKRDNDKRLLFDMKNVDALQSMYDYLSKITNEQSQAIAKTSNNFNNVSNAIENESHRLLLPSITIGPILGMPCTLKLNDCLCLNIIFDAMQLYQIYCMVQGNNQTVQEAVYDNIGNHYNSSDLLDDFNHLIFCHGNQFEDICNILTQSVYPQNKCHLAQCEFMRRHHRDRSKITKGEMLLSELYFNDERIADEQLLDRIHCYYFHAFDTGLRLSNKEKSIILDRQYEQNVNETGDITADYIVSQVDALLRAKKRHREYMPRYHDRKCRFVFQEEEKQNDYIELNEYSYGYRFFYWPYYKNNTHTVDDAIDQSLSPLAVGRMDSNLNYTLGDWYIDRKYLDLKEELLCNEICIINKLQWQHLFAKSDAHLNTDNIRSMHCVRVQCDMYEMHYGDLFKPEHLIAMMTYCNYDQLQFAFSATFRKEKKNDTNITVKTRHRNYYFMGRYLRECVECFGSDLGECVSTQINLQHLEHNMFHMFLYRGITDCFIFSSMNAIVKCPFSTTTSYSVASTFCNNDGMVLELMTHIGGNSMNGIKGLPQQMCCFDCQPISDYPNEQEILLIGGSMNLQFNNIIQVKECVNYKLYMKAIQQLAFRMQDNGCNTTLIPRAEISKVEQQLIYKLLSHEVYRYQPTHEMANEFKNGPQYIKDIVHLHCTNVQFITLYSSKSNGGNIIDLFFKTCDHDAFINLDLLNIVFPNMTQLRCFIHAENGEYVKDFLSAISCFVTMNNTSPIVNFLLHVDNKCKSNIEGYIDQNSNLFLKHGWFIAAAQANTSWIRSFWNDFTLRHLFDDIDEDIIDQLSISFQNYMMKFPEWRPGTKCDFKNMDETMKSILQNMNESFGLTVTVQNMGSWDPRQMCTLVSDLGGAEQLQNCFQYLHFQK
eukprot:4130_1